MTQFTYICILIYILLPHDNMQNNDENIVCPKSESAAQQQRVLNLRIANIYHSYNNKKTTITL